ncbi:bifunctional phosphoribosylaminoimidazolecarboxamide formyltransferase/IMP cyclohydrolase [Erysipelothrix aquatica]|uniref:bifunctional phosphoribosylaminoimidazolecarboxamide formyltransferase/IMP cyclohydrolase n=1 Tax=Erysipelothrix aquatica TaxID=2683714 RepID=UPI001356A8F6|nr:bifunctional phosphoribosylaminoimidazolecarboxamide formyltransferase/IMP cyclohydrolase [Erysipelothrix aquatica]
MSKRVLMSVYDKEGIVDFAKSLIKLDWEIVSTGGTYKLLLEEGVKVTEVNAVTDFPEILNGRVKTLHPAIHGGILAKRNCDMHMDTIKTLGITPFDMVVCNLYPFEATIRDESKTDVDIIENIDIGGPAMIRSAAKNYRDVYVVTDRNDYNLVVDALHSDDFDIHQYLASKAFSLTASYDALISQYFLHVEGNDLPSTLTKTYRKVSDLRYGENPHQKASYYEEITASEAIEFRQLHGKELSYNNINDMTGALRVLQEFTEPTAVAVKHANPSGIGSAETLKEAFEKARDCDPESIFGGIIALNRPVKLDVAMLLSDIFLEVIVAPSFTHEAQEKLMKKKNVRLIEMPKIQKYHENSTLIKDVLNGVLVQERDLALINEAKYEVVSKRQPTPEVLEQLDFAWKACKQLASNAIVIAKNNMTLGLGHGEVQRYWACEKAIERSLFPVEGSVMASDAFFFEDTIELCAKHGIKAIIQPGGSVKDHKVIELADKYDMTLIFTGMRHFRH